MILLEPGHKILQETLASRLETAEVCDVKAADFDDVMYHITSHPSDKNIIRVSISLRCYSDIMENGGQDMLDEEYKDMVDETESGFDLTIKINREEAASNPAAMAEKVAQLKRNLIGAPLVKAFEASNAKKGLDKGIEIKYRSDESMYVVSDKDRVAVIFRCAFRETTDIAIAKVFLQEFAETQRRLQAAPTANYRMDIPDELKGFDVQESDSVGFIVFNLMPRHFDKKEKAKKAISVLFNFRNYLMYHIKCSKAYMHMRMRRRVESLLQVLNRAIPDKPAQPGTKTMSGRKFERK